MGMQLLNLMFTGATLIASMMILITLWDKEKIPKREKNEDLEKCKIASMQLFAGISKLMELMEDGRKWNKNRSDYVIKEMEREKERISGKKTNP